MTHNANTLFFRVHSGYKPTSNGCGPGDLTIQVDYDLDKCCDAHDIVCLVIAAVAGGGASAGGSGDASSTDTVTALHCSTSCSATEHAAQHTSSARMSSMPAWAKSVRHWGRARPSKTVRGQR